MSDEIIISEDIFIKAAINYHEQTGIPLNLSNFSDVQKTRQKLADLHAMIMALKYVGAL